MTLFVMQCLWETLDDESMMKKKQKQKPQQQLTHFKCKHF